MDWTLLQTLVACAEHGSFTEAARALGVHQSTVSRRIAELEGLAGEPVFDRVQSVATARGLALLDAARPMAAGALAASAALVSDLGVSGTVRLACAVELVDLLVDELPTLRARHPALSLELLAGSRLTRLASGEADLAVRPRPADGQLVARRVLHVEYGIYAIDMRNRMEWVGFTEELAELAESRWLARIPGAIRVLRVDDTMALARAASLGIGLALLPRTVGEARPELVRRVDLEARLPPLPTRDLWLVVHQHLQNVPRVRAVADWVVASLGKYGADQG